MEPDFYRILGVGEAASDEEIKKAYRAVAKKYHPDANQGDRAAAERFKAVSEAYAVIGDEKKRREYDSRRAAGVPRGNQSSGSRKPEGSFAGASFVNLNKKTKTNPMDVTEMFERYMGIKKK